MHGSYILVIGGSTRLTRRSPTIAAWVAALGRDLSQLPFETVDLIDLKLGFDDEPGVPALHGYVSASTRAWSEQVASSAGVVFVTPQYNWGYPAALKNAIDRLHREWRDKPALIVTYGSHGGGKCAAQLRQVLEGLHLNLVPTMPALRLSRGRIEANDGEVDPAQDFADHRDELRQALRELTDIVSPIP